MLFLSDSGVLPLAPPRLRLVLVGGIRGPPSGMYIVWRRRSVLILRLRGAAYSSD